MFFLGGFIKRLYKCPTQDMKEACQALYELNELLQLRIHIREQALEHFCPKHKKIHFLESGDLDMDYIINVYWFKAVYYQDLEANVRDMIFQRTTFAVKNPKPPTPALVTHQSRLIAAPTQWPEQTSDPDPLKALEAISTASTSNL